MKTEYIKNNAEKDISKTLHKTLDIIIRLIDFERVVC